MAVFLGDDPVCEVDRGDWAAADESQAAVFAGYRLQDVADYRGALQAWFRAVRVGGHLVVVVPHAFLYERRLALPSPWHPGQRRLYTPRALIEEVEEALAPNSYRLRLLVDDDAGYDYARPSDLEPDGHADVLLVVEKIAAPAWPLVAPAKARLATPDYAFEPARTRVELATLRPRGRILILKLDHLGDFIMGIDALERARAAFPYAEITLVVGSWNLDMARELGVADHVVAFDAFPRNSSEEEVDVPGKAALLGATIGGAFDIAIDLRTDGDTRRLLRNVKASLRAGIGTRAQFPFLDIFLPLDFNRNEPETAQERLYTHHEFNSQSAVARGDFRSRGLAATVERHSAIIWGPYHGLRPGRYFFEPHIEVDAGSDGLLMLDVGLDAERMAHATLPAAEQVRLPFTVERPGALFEFRVWMVEDLPALDFSFFGGRLVREGAASVLHQSEYLSLLIELVAMRVGRTGMLGEAA